MPRDIIILECTEAKAEGKPTSRYVTTRNKKSLRTLRRFMSERAKILPRRVTGLSAKMHRKITREIKRARAINLLP